MANVMAMTEVGMLNDVQRMHAISHNLANASTVGFKQEVAIARPFIDHLEIAGGSSMRGEVHPVMTTLVDHSEGAFKYTANPLDLGVEGSGFFVVATPGGEAYTRQGNFNVDASGRLATGSGYAVMGAAGEIRLTSPTPRIDAQGNVWEDNTQVAQLKLVSVKNPSSLISTGAGTYLPSESTEIGDDAVRVRQGFTEAANVVAMKEMIKLIETVRHFEASQRLLRGYDTMLDRAINVAGEIS